MRADSAYLKAVCIAVLSLNCSNCTAKVQFREFGAWQKRAIRESFLHENRIFHQFVKVFFLKSVLLYGIKVELSHSEDLLSAIWCVSASL